MQLQEMMSTYKNYQLEIDFEGLNGAFTQTWGIPTSHYYDDFS